MRVPPQAYVTGRRVPEPAREIADLDLERIAALGWRGLDEAALGGWTLRAAQGFTGRANSVLPLGDPDRPLDEALAHVRDWYAARGLPARFQVPLPARADLDAALAERGWTAYDPTRVMTADLVAIRARTADRRDLPPVALLDAPDEAWLAAYDYRGRGALPPVAREVLVRGPALAFAAVVEGGATMAVGRGAVAERWLGVTAMEVAPAARRRGLAQHVLRALAAWGARTGARHAYLQVSAENGPAAALYEQCGFAAHHGYHYRAAP